MSQNLTAIDASKQLERFHNSYEIDPISDCWNWKLALNPDGYGRCYYDGVSVRAHRLSYQLHYGDFPRHMVVCHKCDNPRCVNPHHLFIGTPKDNMADKRQKGRAKGINKGELNGSAKLSKNEISEILTLLDQGLKQHEVARLFGVTQSHVSRVKSGQRWLK